MPRLGGAFLCGPGLHGCYLCNQLSRYQCDCFVTPPGARPRRRCNRHLCEQHRTSLSPNKDACPEHAPVCLAALERAAARKLQPVLQAIEDTAASVAVPRQDAQWLVDRLRPPDEPGDWKLCRGLGGQVQWLRAEDVPAWRAEWQHAHGGPANHVAGPR